MASAVAVARLRSFVERIERINEEIEASTADRREVYEEAAGEGFDTKALRKLIARRKVERDVLMEEDAILEMYEGAVNGSKTAAVTEDDDPW